MADEGELEDYFNTIDYDEDGYVCYEDFEHNIMLNTEEDGPGAGEEQPVSLLTLEVLAEMRNLFQFHKKRNYANIEEMKDNVESGTSGFAITSTDFKLFFNEYLKEARIYEDDFTTLVNDYEAKLFSVAGIKAKGDALPSVEPKIQDKDATIAASERPGSTTAYEVFTSKEVVDEEDPEMPLQELLDEICDQTDLSAMMDSEKLSRVFETLRTMVGGVVKKISRLEDETKNGQNNKENEEYEKGYMTTKIHTLT